MTIEDYTTQSMSEIRSTNQCKRTTYVGANWLKIYVDYPISCFSCSINSIHLLFDKYINQSMNQYIIYYISVYYIYYIYIIYIIYYIYIIYIYSRPCLFAFEDSKKFSKFLEALQAVAPLGHRIVSSESGWLGGFLEAGWVKDG